MTDLSEPKVADRGEHRSRWRRLVWTWAPAGEREAGDAVVRNFLLHWFPSKVARRSIATSYSMWLGTISALLFLILILTGIPLMFLYVPSVERAYASIKDLEYVVSFGRFLRASHRIAAHLMVIAVFLHMVRVFLTGAFKNGVGVRQHRPVNWWIGLAMHRPCCARSLATPPTSSRRRSQAKPANGNRPGPSPLQSKLGARPCVARHPRTLDTPRPRP